MKFELGRILAQGQQHQSTGFFDFNASILEFGGQCGVFGTRIKDDPVRIQLEQRLFVFFLVRYRKVHRHGVHRPKKTQITIALMNGHTEQLVRSPSYHHQIVARFCQPVRSPVAVSEVMGGKPRG